MTNNSDINPFIYGPPVKGNDFIGRQSELKYVLSRVTNHGQSTAIVGEPHVGKTSVLLKLYSVLNQQRNTKVVLLDLHGLETEFSPQHFWAKSLNPIIENPSDSKTNALLKRIADSDYTDRFLLESLFEYLEKKSRQLVLLLDEFDCLLPTQGSSKFNFSFFATLRALDKYNSFTYIPATRTPLSSLNKLCKDLPNSGGSEIFNTLTEMLLLPFDFLSISELFSKANGTFTEEELFFIRRVAGRNPFFIQAMCSVFYDKKHTVSTEKITEFFYDAVQSQFANLWDALDQRCKTTVVILSLVELGGQACGKDFSFGEIEKVEKFGRELRQLQKLGLAELIEKTSEDHFIKLIFDLDHCLIWRKEKWSISSQAFAWWIRDMIISKSVKIDSFEEWLDKKEYLLLLTNEQWNYLLNAIGKAPSWAVRGVSGLAKQFIQELFAKKLA